MTEYSASTENLLEDRRLDVVPSSQDMYMSLMPSVASPQRSLVHYNPQTSTSYLHPHQSTVSLCNSHKHRKGKRTHRKDSSSTESRQTEIVKHKFKKLQICFVVLSALNIVMLVVFVVTYPKFGPLFSDNNGDFTETGDGQLKTFKLCTKCQPLLAKVGFAGGLIENIRSTNHEEFCCFRRIDQILRLFDGYAEKYVDQEIFKVRQEMKYNLSSQIGPISNKALALAHLYYSNTDVKTGREPLIWETKGVDILLVGSMKVEGQKHLQIPESGYYYVYSHLQIKTNKSAFHVVMLNYEKKFSKKILTQKIKGENSVPVSHLQGVFRLKKGDRLTVIAEKNSILSGERWNYFGVFMLQL